MRRARPAGEPAGGPLGVRSAAARCAWPVRPQAQLLGGLAVQGVPALCAGRSCWLTRLGGGTLCQGAGEEHASRPGTSLLRAAPLSFPAATAGAPAACACAKLSYTSSHV